MLAGRSFRLGKLFGIDVGVNFNWFIIFALITMSLSNMYRQDFGYGGGAGFFLGAVTALFFFASVVAHEYGHALTARVFGIRTHRINLHLFGGVAFLEREPKRPSHEFWIAIAGPAVSIVLGVAFAAAYFVARGYGFPVLERLLLYLGVINIVLGVFNCVPGFPLDGGRVVRAFLWGVTGNYLLSTRIAAWGGVVVGAMISSLGVLFLMMGAVMAGVINIFLGIFVIYLARMSSQQAEVLDAFSNMRVADLMRPIRIVLPSGTYVSDAYERYFLPFNVDQLPVVAGDRLLGFVRADDIAEIPRRQWDWMRVDEIARPYDTSILIDPQMEAITAFERLATANAYSVPVFEGRRLMGTVNRHDLARVLERRRTPAAPA